MMRKTATAMEKIVVSRRARFCIAIVGRALPQYGHFTSLIDTCFPHAVQGSKFGTLSGILCSSHGFILFHSNAGETVLSSRGHVNFAFYTLLIGTKLLPRLVTSLQPHAPILIQILRAPPHSRSLHSARRQLSLFPLRDASIPS